MSVKEKKELLNKQEKADAYRCIDTIKKTSLAVISLLEEDEENEFVTELEYTAESLVKHHNLDETVMADYQNKMQIARKEDVPRVNVSISEVELARLVILKMCDCLDNPKEIMRHVRVAFDVMAMWEPCKI